jgi:hypothetical protein
LVIDGYNWLGITIFSFSLIILSSNTYPIKMAAFFSKLAADCSKEGDTNINNTNIHNNTEESFTPRKE